MTHRDTDKSPKLVIGYHSKAYYCDDIPWICSDSLAQLFKLPNPLPRKIQLYMQSQPDEFTVLVKLPKDSWNYDITRPVRTLLFWSLKSWIRDQINEGRTYFGVIYW